MGFRDDFLPVPVAVLTVSDTRTETDDSSGGYLVEALRTAGHAVVEKLIVRDDVYRIRAAVSRWIADDAVSAVIVTGGTGVTGRDGTPEAIAPLLDKQLDGFGELFRRISFDELGGAAIQSRALAGVANGTWVFCLPGSTGACRTAWEGILREQLDARTRPCNFVDLMPRLREK